MNCLFLPPAHCDVPLVGEGDGDEDGGAEGDVVEGVDEEGEEVHEQAGGDAEGPALKEGCRISRISGAKSWE